MFEDENNLLGDEQAQYTFVGASKWRMYYVIKQHKRVCIHVIAHHAIQLICLLLNALMAVTTLVITEHTVGIKLAVFMLVLSVVTPIIYLAYILLLVGALSTHPVFTANPSGSSLLTKIANGVHTLYTVTLVINFFTSMLLALSFNPTGNLKEHSTNGLIVTAIMAILYLFVSCCELQKPLLFIPRKHKSVEMTTDQVEDPMKGSANEDMIGVWTFGLNIFGLQCYIKYHIDPTLSTVQPEVYFGGKVKSY